MQAGKWRLEILTRSASEGRTMFTIVFPPLACVAGYYHDYINDIENLELLVRLPEFRL